MVALGGVEPPRLAARGFGPRVSSISTTGLGSDGWTRTSNPPLNRRARYHCATSDGAGGGTRTRAVALTRRLATDSRLAETGGFEPPVLSHTRLANGRIRPLCHVSCFGRSFTTLLTRALLAVRAPPAHERLALHSTTTGLEPAPPACAGMLPLHHVVWHPRQDSNPQPPGSKPGTLVQLSYEGWYP